MKALLFFFAALLAVAPLGASAQDAKAQQPQPKVEYEKKTVINFEDDTIEGDLKRPDGEYVEARRKVDHSNLIKIREEWRDKVKQAAAQPNPPVPTPEQIQKRAYELFKARGGEPGRELDDWLLAEHELEAEIARREENTE